MPSSRRTSRLVRPAVTVAVTVAVAVACAVTVAVSGELSTGALLAVGGTGVLVTAVGLARRAGGAAPPVGRRALPWVGWLGAVLAWEVTTLLDDDLPTVSDLADPLLAHPAARAAATCGWVAAGAWLLCRPASRAEGP